MTIKCIAYSTNDFYAAKSLRLEASLTKYGIPYEIRRLEHPGSWHKAVSMKPKFIHDMLAETTLDGVLYLDADAEVVAPLPIYQLEGYDAAFTKFRRSPGHEEEFLTGTMFFRKHGANVKVDQMLDVLDRWAELTELCGHSSTPEQDALKRVMSDSTGICAMDLGPAWTYIHDDFKGLFPDVQPLIMHYQASREYRQMELKDARAKEKAQKQS